MKFVSKDRFLEIYAGVLTAVFAVTVFAGFADSKKTTARGAVCSRDIAYI